MVAQRPSLATVDVIPDDPAYPPMSDVPLRMGAPGVRCTLKPGATVLVGWENARPDRPYVGEWLPGEDSPAPLLARWYADQIELGGAAVEALVHGTSWSSADDALVAGLISAFTALGTAAGLATPLNPLEAGFGSAASALTAYKAAKAAAGRFLSTKVRAQ